jgi:hypothetical protein
VSLESLAVNDDCIIRRLSIVKLAALGLLQEVLSSCEQFDTQGTRVGAAQEYLLPFPNHALSTHDPRMEDADAPRLEEATRACSSALRVPGIHANRRLRLRTCVHATVA